MKKLCREEFIKKCVEKNIKNRDEAKNKWCIENNINLIRIKYDQINNIRNILKNNLTN